MEDTGVTQTSCAQGASGNASWNRLGGKPLQRRKVAVRSATAVQG